MSTRVYLLVFILSRMLNPLSYTVFMVYFVLIAVSTGTVIPKGSLIWIADWISPLYMPLVFVDILTCCVVFGVVVNFLYRVMVDGKYIVKLSTFSLLLALSSMQVLAYFCMNALPKVDGTVSVEQTLSFWFGKEVYVLEMSAILIMGILLSLYVGVLSREKFKKNIGFVDDTISE